MYRKVFEKKFRDSAEATDALDKAGWTYAGKKGVLRKYHLYTGVTIDIREGRLREAHKLRLHSDGHVELFNDYSISSTISTGALPAWVLLSKDVYDHLKTTIAELNGKLAEEHGHQFYIEWDGNKMFGVYELATQVGHPGKTIKKTSCASFIGPMPAFEWAVSQSGTAPR